MIKNYKFDRVTEKNTPKVLKYLQIIQNVLYLYAPKTEIYEMLTNFTEEIKELIKVMDDNLMSERKTVENLQIFIHNLKEGVKK